MRTNKVLSFLVGIFACFSVSCAEVIDTLDLGIRQTPFSFTEVLLMSNNQWRLYKITLPKFTRLRISYDIESYGSVMMYLHDADMKLIESRNLDNRKGEWVYMRELSSGTYYYRFQPRTQFDIAVTLEGVEQEDAAVNDSHNYLRTRTMTAKDGSSYMENILYFDALGRLHESIDVGITPTGKDLATLIEYDEFGREKKKWLPTVVENNNGHYIRRSLLKENVSAFYDNDMEPYALIEYENSPLNRIVWEYKPGKVWHTSANGTKKTYNLNRADGGRNYDRSFKEYNPLRNGGGSNYPANTLFVITKSGAGGSQSIENIDARGRTIYSRRTLKQAEPYEKGGIYADVEYYYDAVGNLLGVFTPVESDFNSSGVSASHQIYRYEYDYRDRRIAYQYPQCEWVYNVYDRADRLVLSQDGVQRTTNQWTFYKYDTMGREVLKGTCTTSRSHAELRTLCQTMLVEESFDRTQPYGYTWSKLLEIISSDSPVLNVNYYDDYNILGYQSVANYTPDFKGDACYTGSNEGYESKGLLTVSSTAILGGNTTSRIHKLHYYDRMERPVATISDIYSPQKGVEDYKQAEYLSYTFGGSVSTKIMHLAGKDEERYDYTYDHAGRHISTRHNLFSDHVAFETKTYDELGRLKSKTPLGLTDQTITYAYDMHSRLTSLQQKNFGEELEYTFTDNISKQKFRDDGTYTFTYDGLSRVEQAIYSNGSINRSCYFTYDKNSNLLSLTRYMGETYEMIEMEYFKNQMIRAEQYASVSDSYVYRKYDHYKKEYVYDANGSIVQALGRGISSIKYNTLKLPEKLEVKHYLAEGRNEYTYSGEGNRLNVNYRWNPQRQSNPIIGSAVNESSLTMNRNVLYQGNHIWFDNKEMCMNDLGYFLPSTSKFYFYVKDHQGNNRVVIDQSGTVVQKNAYYPYGLPMENRFGSDPVNADVNNQPFKYNGKELDLMHGMILYDYGSRLMDPTFPRFLTIDPLCELDYGVSPYAYCANNFVNAIDPTGRAWRLTKDKDHEENVFYNGYEWVDESESYDSEGNLLKGLYEQAIFFSDNGTFNSKSDYNIGSSTATVYLADGTIQTFDACTNPSGTDYATVPEGIFHATVGKHKGQYTALRMSDTDNSGRIELGGSNPAHPERTYAEGINIHKPGKNNLTGMTWSKSPISAGCLLIDMNSWNSFIGIFDTVEQRMNTVSVTVSRSMKIPVNGNRLPAFNFTLNGTRRSFFNYKF